MTLVGATLAAKGLLGWSWPLATLFGSLVTVTGPTVVTPLVREVRLRPRLRTILEAEGVLIDPIGAILAVLVLEIVLVPAAGTVALGLVDLVVRLGVGSVAGVVGGLILGALLRWRLLIAPGLENIFTLAGVVLLFEGANLVISYSGILAVAVAGVVIGNMGTPVDRDLKEFKDQLTVMLVGLIFILLAAGIALEDVRGVGLGGALVIAALVLVVRPAGVWLSTRTSQLSVKERLFVAWVGPRGIVAAAVTSITAATLDAQGIPGGPELRALVFLAIAVTVVLAGFTAGPVARLFGLRLPERERVAILGAQGLGLLLGEQLRDAGAPVIFLDSDPRHCRDAEESRFPVIFGDALLERTLQRAQVELVGTAIGATPNDHLNSLFVSQARSLFRVPVGVVAVNSLPGEKAPEHAAGQAGRVLFEGPHDVERWDVRWRHGEVVVERFRFQPSPEQVPEGTEADTPRSSSRGGERFVILTVRRGKKTTPMTFDLKPRSGDVVTVVLFRPEREEAIKQLAESGWHPAPEVADRDEAGAADAGEPACNP